MNRRNFFIALLVSSVIVMAVLNYGTKQVSRVNLLPQFASKLMGIETQETSHDPRSKLDELLERKFQLQESQRELRLQTEKITSELESLHDQIDSEKYSVDGTKLPLSLMTITTYTSPTNNDTEPTLPFCDMDNCFDYSRCPVTSTFTFFLYTESGDQGNSQLRGDLDKLNKVLSSNKHRVSEPYRACVYIKLVESCEVGLRNLEKLPHWDNEGENHVIWTDCDHDTVRHWTVGRAIIVSSDGFGPSHRSNFDLIVGHWQSLNSSGSDTWKDLPLLFPVYRKFLLTYFGPKLSHNSSQIALENLQTNSSSGVHFQFCNYATDSNDPERSEEEAIVDLMSTAVTSTLSDCSNHHARQNYVLNSTFSLMFLIEFGVNRNFQRELFGILKAGSIPVIFGTMATKYLPFNEVLDWSKLVLVYPLARIPEIYHMLRSFSENDVLMFKQNGRLAFEKYFSTIERTVETALAVLRTRIGLAPVPYENALSPSVFSDTFQPKKVAVTVDLQKEGNLGPVEEPFNSPKFRRNLSVNSLRKYEVWNSLYQPFKLYPYTPWDPSLPKQFSMIKKTTRRLKKIATTARPNATTKPKLGLKFDGIKPEEQFTIVILTYKREDMLVKNLKRLHRLPYLNKIVIVWNGPNQPARELEWPNISSPVYVIRSQKNSLNNRFMPYDVIETEAILSMDDDVSLTRDQIVFGFRVWTENRDRLVGYPARYHLWKEPVGWQYRPGEYCELSLILTGAAFFHKMYAYMYTYEMPQAIRTKIDEQMNCEDLAMNFLIAHYTQKPPIKVTDKGWFACSGCKSGALSHRGSHYRKRTNCMNLFTQIYGYMPLRYTLFRADSVLYRKGIRHNNPPCFKNV